MKKLNLLLFVLQLSCIACVLSAQQFVANYDETKMPAYNLPDPLVFENGTAVKQAGDWEKRRVELLNLFENEVYGASPVWHGKISAEELGSDIKALSGLAEMRQIKLTLVNGSKEHSMILLLFLPHSAKKVPVFLGYNFNGNHTVADDPLIIPSDVWNIDGKNVQQVKGTDAERGKSYQNWQVKEIITRGYGLATVYYGDVDPDYDDGFKNGVHSLYDSRPDATSWGSIAGWAWGLSRIMDYLVTLPEVDAQKVIVMGHSRLGKTALWAGVTDQRFAMVISNNSGCGGAALSKRVFGETVGYINRSFPHWFCDNFNKYNEKEEMLPVDQHELLALIAPRPVYVASAEDDQWADPRGEFLSCVAASPVYELLGKKGIPVKEMPPVNTPVSETIGYHIRTGGHDVKLYDWNQYLDFADKYFKH